MMHYIIGMILAFAAAFIGTLILGFKDEEA